MNHKPQKSQTTQILYREPTHAELKPSKRLLIVGDIAAWLVVFITIFALVLMVFDLQIKQVNEQEVKASVEVLK